jgi:hypothetical protein
MKLAALTLALAAFVVAAPAWAQVPSVVPFAPGQTTPLNAGDVSISDSECTSSTVPSGGRDGGPYLHLNCASPQINFRQRQGLVELFVRLPFGGEVTLHACAEFACDLASQTVTGTEWTPVVLVAPGIEYVQRVFTSSVNEFDLDDIAYSPSSDNPETAISPSLEITSTHPFGAGFWCGIDGAPLAPCLSIFAPTGVPPGPHTLAAAAIDAYGRLDPTPATAGFTVPAPPPPDSDKDGLPDTSDNCPVDANTDQSDGDKDGVGDACEELPSGNTPPTAGVTAVVRQLSGEVFVKLPAGRGFRQETGFIPLKGVAAIPIGSTVDARKGEIEVSSAANGFSPRDRRAKRQQARIRAGMFAIRQKRAKRNVAKKTAIGTDVALLSPPGTETQCRRSGPQKGVVRSVSMVAKGLYRAIGGATTSTAKNATFATTDRCDGTLTEVGKGRVSVKVKGRKKPVVVRGGAAYFAKAKLFAARKGKRPLRD